MSERMLQTRTANIRLVAREAGVSQTTVSRAFSQPDLLAPATVERVREAAERLGYVPNQVARALSTGRTGNLALILPDVTNPFFAALMRGAQSQAYKRGYATFLGDSDETDALEDLLMSKLAAQVDGFVLASPRLDEQRIRHHAARRPLVVINRDLEGIDRVLVDTAGGFAAAVELLAGLGHRRIAYVGAPRSSWSNQQRGRAVDAAAAVCGLEVFHVDAARPSHEAGLACVGRVLETGVTAALAVDDVVAQGMMAGLADQGLSVPADFSLVGCDDVIARTIYPQLTTVGAHCALAGSNAVDLLLNGLTGPAGGGERHVIAGELIVRQSTGQVPAASRTSARRQRTAQATASTPASAPEAAPLPQQDIPMIDTRLYPTKTETGAAAAAFGARAIADAIVRLGRANIVVATGASQFEMLAALVEHDEIDWSRVTAFHLDEYIDMPDTHPASFRGYLKERFTGKLPTLGAFHFIEGDAPDLDAELTRINTLLDQHPIDVMFAGIGENGHLAFNDPPADFTSTVGYKVVELEERCRQQQFGEGWFATFDDVPTEAISMTVQRILSSGIVILTVPDERKAEAVREVLEGEVSNMWPASILQQHPDCHLFLDVPAASRLTKKPAAASA